MPATDERLLRIVARAAPAADRTADGAFGPAARQDQARIERLARTRVGARSGIAPGTAPGDHDLDEEGEAQLRLFRLQAREVEVRDAAALPAWAQTMRHIFSSWADAPDRDDPAARWGTLAPLVRVAGRDLGAIIERCGVPITREAHDDLLTGLARRLWRPCEQVLELERRSAAAMAGFLRGLGDQAGAVDPASQQAWLDRLERFPVLAYLIGTGVRDWLRLVEEALQRLAADRQQLIEVLFAGQDPGALSGLEGDAGDVHDHGRAVMLLTFEGGARVVYKPKDLRISAAFYRLVASLNAAGLEPPLPVPAILVHEGYAWEEHIAHEPCPDAAAVRRYYQRMGMWVRLFELLEGRDLWLDNLVARGEEPIFIDLETLLQPRRPAPRRPAAEQAALDRLEDSATPTCAVAMPTPIAPGVRAEDLGALTPVRSYLTPFARPDAPPGAGPETPPAERFVTWDHPEHGPVLDGVTVPAASHLEAVLAGYRTMGTRLQAMGPTLRATEGPLAHLRAAPVRFIFRDTWSCIRLTRQSAAPALLTDPLMRQLFLDGLHAATTTAEFEPAERKRTQRLIDLEIERLLDLDVPFFTALPDSADVSHPDGAVVAGFFEGTAWERLERRLGSLQAAEGDEAIDLLRSSFAAGQHDWPVAPPVPDATPRPRGEPAVDWMGQALAIGEELLTWAAPDTGHGARAWLGLVRHPNLDLEMLGVLPPDLLSGTTGLARLFVDLAGQCGEVRWAREAERTLEPTRTALSGIDRQWGDLLRADAPARQVPTACGAFYGLGAHVLTLVHAADVLGQPELVDEARASVLALPLQQILSGASLDTVSGCAGLLIALAALAARRGDDPELAQLVAVAVDHAETTRSENGAWPAPPYPPGVRGLDGLPGTAAGMLLARHRLERAGLGAGPPASELRELLPTAEAADVSSGDLAACLSLVGERDMTPADRRRLRRAVKERVRAMGAGSTISESLDVIEIALAAELAYGDPAWREQAEAAGCAILAARQRTGAWFGDPFAADRHRLSIVSGVPAIAHAFLRLATTPSASRERLASVRLAG